MIFGFGVYVPIQGSAFDPPKERPLDIRESPEFLEIAHRVRDGLRAGRAYEEV